MKEYIKKLKILKENAIKEMNKMLDMQFSHNATYQEGIAQGVQMAIEILQKHRRMDEFKGFVQGVKIANREIELTAKKEKNLTNLHELLTKNTKQ